MTTATDRTPDTDSAAVENAPVVADMSSFLISGAVSAVQPEGVRATFTRTPAQGIEDGVLAERLGVRRVWLSERLDIKSADVILSGIAARTTRLEVGTGIVAPTQRHPWVTAAYGATMHACFGPRFNLGLGRSDEGWLRGTGIRVTSYEYMDDYIDILRRLWRGESIDYEGPVGKFDGMSVHERYPGPPPQVWIGSYAFPRAAKIIAKHADGVLLIPMMTPAAVSDSVERIHRACAEIGRDPGQIRICALVVTAPDLDDFETRAMAHGRMVTYLTYVQAGDALRKANNWDPAIVERLRNHSMFQSLTKVPDLTFHRHQMMEAAALIPDEYMQECSALGSVSECVTSLQRFIDAGADEIVTYGSTPAQNAGLVSAWRDRPGKQPSTVTPTETR